MFDHSEMQDTSLCMDCAVAPELKRFVAKNQGPAKRCAACHITDVPLSSETKVPALASLIRALVRLHFNEADYNPHFGGEDIDELFKMENPIIDFRRISNVDGGDGFDLFLREVIFWPPYPPGNSGIAIYGGPSRHTDRGPLLRALKNSKAEELIYIEQRLRKENAYNIEPDVLRYIETVRKAITGRIKAGEVFYRCRVGHNGLFLQHGDHVDYREVYLPYMGDRIGAPPPPLASSGRANRQGVSFLYLATEAPTAIAEIRPHPGHIVSIGAFQAKRTLKVANFGRADLVKLCRSEVDLSFYHFCISVDKHLSDPVTPEERVRYTSMQLIAEVARHAGFDGIAYRSSVETGRNVCIFNPDDCEYVPKSGQAFKIRALAYETQSIEHTLDATDLHQLNGEK